MKYLISGHEGWLGSNFLKKCERNGLHCLTIDGDLSDEKLLQNRFDDDIVIVHFAGCKNNLKDESLRNNVVVTSQLVRLAMSVSCKHFIYVSSIAAVGPSKDIVNSSTICKPISYYGKSKLICEQIVSGFLDSYTIVRPTNIVDGNQVGVLAVIYQSIKNNSPYEAWEQSLKSMRDYISLNDVLEAIYKITINPIEKNGHYKIVNLGSGFSYSMGDIIKLIEDKLQIKINKNIIRNDNFSKYDLYIDNSNTVEILEKKPELLSDIINQCSWLF